MNTFYQNAKWIQWTVALILLFVCIVCMIIWVELIEINLILYLVGLILIAPILQFCVSPILKLVGAYEYLSPMMLVFSPNDKKYDLHNGTSFDYLFVMRKVPAGKATESRLLAYFCEGFLEIIKRIEEGKLPKEVQITGTSYFMSERSVKRLGFKIGKKNWFLSFNLYLNYLDLLWMYSRSKGKFTFPKVWEAKSIEMKGEKLVENKDYIIRLHERLIR